MAVVDGTKSAPVPPFAQKIHGRLEALRAGKEPPDQHLVPGARVLLEALEEQSLSMYLAGSTDQKLVPDEGRPLEVARYFEGGVYGTLDNYKSFSKRILIQRLIDSDTARGSEFIRFGDSYVEIENIEEVGGAAVSVATAEPECLVEDEWRRRRLAGTGADVIIANYLECEGFQRILFSK